MENVSFFFMPCVGRGFRGLAVLTTVSTFYLHAFGAAAAAENELLRGQKMFRPDPFFRLALSLPGLRFPSLVLSVSSSPSLLPFCAVSFQPLSLWAPVLSWAKPRILTSRKSGQSPYHPRSRATQQNEIEGLHSASFHFVCGGESVFVICWKEGGMEDG